MRLIENISNKSIIYYLSIFLLHIIMYYYFLLISTLISFNIQRILLLQQYHLDPFFVIMLFIQPASQSASQPTEPSLHSTYILLHVDSFKIESSSSSSFCFIDILCGCSYLNALSSDVYRVYCIMALNRILQYNSRHISCN